MLATLPCLGSLPGPSASASPFLALGRGPSPADLGQGEEKNHHLVIDVH